MKYWKNKNLDFSFLTFNFSLIVVFAIGMFLSCGQDNQNTGTSSKSVSPNPPPTVAEPKQEEAVIVNIPPEEPATPAPTPAVATPPTDTKPPVAKEKPIKEKAKVVFTDNKNFKSINRCFEIVTDYTSISKAFLDKLVKEDPEFLEEILKYYWSTTDVDNHRANVLAFLTYCGEKNISIEEAKKIRGLIEKWKDVKLWLDYDGRNDMRQLYYDKFK